MRQARRLILSATNCLTREVDVECHKSQCSRQKSMFIDRLGLSMARCAYRCIQLPSFSQDHNVLTFFISNLRVFDKRRWKVSNRVMCMSLRQAVKEALHDVCLLSASVYSATQRSHLLVRPAAHKRTRHCQLTLRRARSASRQRMWRRVHTLAD